MIEVYGTILARVEETKRGLPVRRLAGVHVIVDVRSIEDYGVRLRLGDGGMITLASGGLVGGARRE